jgi:AAA+ superfamily predicted ATPase
MEDRKGPSEGTPNDREKGGQRGSNHFKVGEDSKPLARESFGGTSGSTSPIRKASPPGSGQPDWFKEIDPSLRQVTVELPVEAWTRCIQNIQGKKVKGEDCVAILSQGSSCRHITGALGLKLAIDRAGSLFFDLNVRCYIDNVRIDLPSPKLTQRCLIRVADNPFASKIVAGLTVGHFSFDTIKIPTSAPLETIRETILGVQKVCEAYFDTLLQCLDIKDAQLKLQVSPQEIVRVDPQGGSRGASHGKEEGVERLLQTTTVALDDIGGYAAVKREIQSLIRLFSNREHFSKYNITPPRGILFAGPPGTGKTMFAKAMCHELGVNFYHVSTSDVMSCLYGESEKQLAEIFDTVETPCVIFVDELEALAPNRDYASEPSRRVLTELLRKLDGISSREGIILLGATNKIEMLDPAITRAGRLDRTIMIGIPDKEAREEIFRVCINRYRKGAAPELQSLESLDPVALARASEGLVGADIAEVMRRLVFSLADGQLLNPDGDWRPNTTAVCSLIDQYHAELELKKGGKREEEKEEDEEERPGE